MILFFVVLLFFLIRAAIQKTERLIEPARDASMHDPGMLRELLIARRNAMRSPAPSDASDGVAYICHELFFGGQFVHATTIALVRPWR